MASKKLRYSIQILSFLIGLSFGFLTFAVMFTTTATETIEKLLPIFSGVLVGSILVTYFLRGKSVSATGLLVGPSLLVIILPLLAIDQASEVYSRSAIAIAILLLCAFSAPAGSLFFRKAPRKKA